MATPRIKRPFAGAASDPSQRQITSFFTFPSSSSPSVSPHASLPVNPPSQPALPPSVQSNLLTVGMRVRKSVPEGYKTGCEYGAFSLWSDSPTLHTTHRTTTPGFVPHRELMPFCGIHNVGGLSHQPVHPPPTMNTDADELPSLDDVPGLSSSQSSVESTESSMSLDNEDSLASSMPRSRKRGYSDNASTDIPVQLWHDEDSWLADEVSPHTEMPSKWGNARVFAVPRGPRGKKSPSSTLTAYSGALEGQENMDDFQDADFLVDLEMGNS